MASAVSSTLDSCHKDGEDFFPSAEELESYYNMLENGTILDLEWQCPGRRPPSPDSSSCGNKEQSNSTDATDTLEPLKSNDFDFSDDIAQPQMRVRIHTSTPKSVKKKTANFAGVMEALKKKNAEAGNSTSVWLLSIIDPLNSDKGGGYHRFGTAEFNTLTC